MQKCKRRSDNTCIHIAYLAIYSYIRLYCSSLRFENIHNKIASSIWNFGGKYSHNAAGFSYCFISDWAALLPHPSHFHCSFIARCKNSAILRILHPQHPLIHLNLKWNSLQVFAFESFLSMGTNIHTWIYTEMWINKCKYLLKLAASKSISFRWLLKNWWLEKKTCVQKYIWE